MSGATSELIDRLSADLQPVARGALVRRLVAGIAPGASLAALAMLLGLGLRHDFSAALSMPSFWIKLVYTALLSVAGMLAIERVARPAETPRRGAIFGLSVLGTIVVMGSVQYAVTPPSGEHAVLLGHSANFCPFAIIVLSVPIYLGAIWALRGLAPTRLTLAGAVAGFLAGALAATIYSFSCGETGIAFLASWYTLGTLSSAALGALVGPVVLRW